MLEELNQMERVIWKIWAMSSLSKYREGFHLEACFIREIFLASTCARTISHPIISAQDFKFQSVDVAMSLKWIRIAPHLLITSPCSHGCRQREGDRWWSAECHKAANAYPTSCLGKNEHWDTFSMQIKFAVFSGKVMNPLGQENWALETQGTNEFFMEQSSSPCREGLYIQLRVLMNFYKKRENNQGAIFPLAVTLSTGSQLNVKFSAQGWTKKAVGKCSWVVWGIACLWDGLTCISIKLGATHSGQGAT